MDNETQAFPSFSKFIKCDNTEIADGSLGMSLADYFAGQWLTGAISAGVYANDTLGRRAYEAADAMLRERERRRNHAT